MKRIEKRTEERVEKAVEQVAGEASATMTANLDASNDRAERIIAGLWMAVAGFITGVQWALEVDGSVWLGIGRWLVVAVGLAGAGYGLFASARWAVGLVETWKGHGMPKWPGWRKR
ncbi:hypothetical protein M3A96_08200 [Helcobacillus massiliensis]|uniref:hypothetical protein n=1 Tax=Helcobacillus massiliensis TaxID=521392 RepID=UPI0021A33390|nr:hypothetical protein [Helcobacillus massiliensis]MCT2036607.1 hypothetical protein [Helcobacillus massiliensis]MCT2332519.1 hypothetical protein [Helcobacillus massiliensis]